MELCSHHWFRKQVSSDHSGVLQCCWLFHALYGHMESQDPCTSAHNWCEVPSTLYSLSGNGWMDMELFHVGFWNHFLRYAPAIRPILLLLDGHSLHYCPETIHFAAQEQFILFVLPPNTTSHLIKGVLGPLKVSWRKECHQYLSENPGRVVTKFQFSEIFNRAWTQSMTMANIVAGFKVTGIYPLNRHALSPPIFEAEKLSQETGLSFLLFPYTVQSLNQSQPRIISQRRRYFCLKEVWEWIWLDTWCSV